MSTSAAYEADEKAEYAKATNDLSGTAWYVCSCGRCPYAFSNHDEGETSVHWKQLRAARSAFGFFQKD